MRILLVEDNQSDARVFHTAMGRSGIPDLDIYHASSLAEAKEALASSSFDIVFSDLGLPDSSGIQTLKSLRELTSTLPVVVTTGDSDDEVSSEALRHGAQDCICKSRLKQFPLDQVARLAIKRMQLDLQEVAREQDLSQFERLEAIGQLAAGIAHEINTPMQYIGDNLRFLKDAIDELTPVLVAVAALGKVEDAGTDTAARLQEIAALAETADVNYLLEELPSAIQQSRDGVGHVTKIVLAMKEFSHPAAQEKKNIDVARAIDSTVTICRNEWKYVAKVELDVPTGLPSLCCHPGEFNQIILNVVVNAAHAIADKLGPKSEAIGTITLRARATEENMVLEISDTGIGMSDEVKRRIFEPFFTTKEVGRGTGQGLTLVLRCVANHGGSIAVESKPGVGTTFRIELPLNDDTEMEVVHHGADEGGLDS
jgi:signal transduction histidine kinase